MKKYTFDELVKIVADLRGEGGCPWDREQTHQSLKKYMIEETYEALDAIDSDNPEKMADELGDLLLQILMNAQIGSEDGRFDINDVISAVSEKMIRRHPHVFGNVIANTSEKVLENWDKIKKNEKGQKSVSETLWDIPASFPALMRAGKVQAKAAKVGFDHEDVSAALLKAEEEIGEIRDAVNEGADVTEEVGDLLFSAVNISRFLGVNAEEALTKSTQKFIKRFEYIENKITLAGGSVADAGLEEMDKLWNEAKNL